MAERRVYLAGHILNMGYKECTDWREYAINELAGVGIKGISPMRFKDELAQEEIITDCYDGTLTCPKGITTRDRFDVMECDIMLANLLKAKNVSIGTMIEYGWADAARKPVITVIENQGNPHDHAMVKEITGFRVETLEEGLHVARAILTP